MLWPSFTLCLALSIAHIIPVIYCAVDTNTLSVLEAQTLRVHLNSLYYVANRGFHQDGHALNSRFPPIPGANMQSPYAQVPCIPLCPRLEKKAVRRKQGSHNHSVLDQCVSTSLGPDLHGLFFQSGHQGSRWVLRARASRAHLLS